MRASTLVGLAIALFLGAVAVVAVRTSGLLDRPQAIFEKQEPVMVLVAKRNIFEGTTASSSDVMLRPASASEIEYLKNNREKLLPANVEAAASRVAARHISVDEMLQKDYFQELAIPDSTTKRLSPGMRSVNVVVPKERAAGGLLRVGEFVDVFFTTTICTDAKCSNPQTVTAPLANHLKIIVKRDNLWTVMQPVGDQPVSYILEANPYRSALIELAKTKGSLTLVPTANNVKAPALNSANDDTARIASFVAGESSVSDVDLERILNLSPLQTPEPPVAIEHYKGVDYVGTTIMDKNYGRPKAGSAGYSMYPPSDVKMNSASATPPHGTTGDCPTCNRGGKK